jgi:methionyl-tRNA synthetase
MIRKDIESNDARFFGDRPTIKWYCPLCDAYGYGDRCAICGVELEPVKQLTEEEKKEEMRARRIARTIAFSSASDLLEEEEDPEKDV